MSAETDLQATISLACKIVDRTQKYGISTAPNLLAMIAAMEASAGFTASNFQSQILQVSDSVRAQLASSESTGFGMLGPLLLDYAALLNIPDTDPRAIMIKLAQHLVDGGLSIKARNFTFGGPAAGGGNVGTGVILRLNKDKDGFPLEAQWAEAKNAICTADQNSGAQVQEERFEFRGTEAGKDALVFETGSGLVAAGQSVSSRNSLLGNPSFSSFGGTAAAPTSVTNWTPHTLITNFVMDLVNYYRPFVGDTTPASLRINASDYMTQALSVRNNQLSPNVPYLLQVAYNAEVGTGTGTLKIRMGSKETTVAVDGKVGWNLLRNPTTPGANCWLQNFSQAGLAIEIEFVRTGGYLLVDDVLLIPGTPFGGGWYWIIGGSTAFLRDDVFTFADTVAADGIVQRILGWRGTGVSLPAVTGAAETWADPV